MKKNKFKLGFRVDAGNLVGTGHLMEVLFLIDRLKQRIALDPIIIANRCSFLADKARMAGINNISYIHKAVSERKEAGQIAEILKRHKCRHLIVDLLERSNKFYSQIRKRVKTLCVILDNSEHRRIPASCVVNFSITQNPGFYKRKDLSRTKYFIGPNYFPFCETIKKIKPVKVKNSVSNILVNQGGSDPYGLTAKIIRALRSLNMRQQVNVIIGGAVNKKHNKELKALKASLKGNYKFFWDLEQQRFHTMLGGIDMAISAAGNTLYELTFLGIPTIVLCHHEEHDKVAAAFEKRRAVVNLGLGRNLPEYKIREAVKRFLDDYPKRLSVSQKAKGIFDYNCDNVLISELIKGCAER